MFVQRQKYKYGDLEGRRNGEEGSGGVSLLFYHLFGQEMRAPNDWKQLQAVTSGARLEQKSLPMQPLKQLPELVPSQTLTSPALFASPFSPTFPAPPSEQRQPCVSNGRMQETCFTWESFKKEKDLPARMMQAMMGPEWAGSVTRSDLSDFNPRGVIP